MSDVRIHEGRRVEFIGHTKSREHVFVQPNGEPNMKLIPVEEWERLPKAGPRRVEE